MMFTTANQMSQFKRKKKKYLQKRSHFINFPKKFTRGECGYAQLF